MPRTSVVAPGFIDLHSHGGLTILAEPRHEPKVRQGVTTEIVGVDGNGFAPFRRREDLEAFVHLDSGLDGRPDIDYDWRSVADYLARYDGTVSLNVGTLVGNSQLRIDALGWDDVPADAAAIDRMRATLRDAMTDGAVGLSTGLDYPPGSFATTEELAQLARTGRRSSAASTTRTSDTRSATATSTRSRRRSRSAGGARRRRTSRTSITARRTRAGPSRCWRWSTTRAPRASTSPSTPIRPSGPARGC